MTVRIIIGFLAVFAAPFIGGILSGLDRMIGARMQRRQGPPLLQPFYDFYKLTKKRANIMNGLQIFLVIGHLMFVALSIWIVYTGEDLLLAVFSLTLAEMLFCLVAFSASAPYSNMSAQRELLQMACAEPMLLLMAIGFYMANGSFKVMDILHSSSPAILKTPGMFAGFLVILVIELRKSPFDVSTSHHAHQEMVKGITTDIAGSVMAYVEVAEWCELFLMATFTGMYFICGNPLSFLAAAAAAALVLFLMTLVDNTFPRVRWERMLWMSWGSTFIFAGVNLLILTLTR